MCSGDRPGAVSGCGLYRILLPAQNLSDLGVDVTVTGSIPGRTRRHPDGLLECYEIRPQDIADFDVVVFQRPSAYTLATVVEQVAKHKPVVVELDDDIERVDPQNAAYPNVNPATSLHENWHHLKRACRAADLVTATTPALMRYAPDGRGAVLPNFVPRVLTTAGRMFEWLDRKPRIGWSGQVATHPTDLQTTRGAVGRVLAATGGAFHVVGDPYMVREHLQLSAATASSDSGWVPIGRYPDALTAIDVGIVPLAHSAFNDAKSCLKGLEFAALGIPFVATPTPEYVRLHDEYGIGLLARRPRDWERHLTALINDEGMRRQLGQEWRETVAGNLTYETNGWRWMQAYEQAIRNASTRFGDTTSGREVAGGTVSVPRPA